MFLRLDCIFEEVAEDKGAVDFCRKGIGRGGFYVDVDVFCTCLPYIDGECGIDQGIFCEVLDAGCVNLIVETLDELYCCLILAACNEIGKHFGIVAEIMANDGKTRLLVL